MPFGGPVSRKYAYYEFVEDWPDMIVVTNELEVRLRAAGRTQAANRLLRAYGQLRDDLLTLARSMSALATKELRDSERNTRVRPDTAGGGGPRLGDYLAAEPIPHQDLLPGSIGVADEELLDNNVPWWLASERGTSALVGRRIFGFFYGADDDAPPSADEFRVHPLFQPGASPVSGMGIIRNPIPARRFIAKSIPAIDAAWKAGFAAAKARFDAELAIVVVTMR